jgi:hypothetical protein
MAGLEMYTKEIDDKKSIAVKLKFSINHDNHKVFIFSKQKLPIVP